MLQVLNLLLSLVVVGKQLLHQLLFIFFQGNVVRVPAQDVLEQTLQLVDIFVSLSPEIECCDLLVLCDVLLFLLYLLLVTLLQVVDDCVVMVAVLLPEFAQCLAFSPLEDELGVSDLKSLLFESFDDLGLGVFLIKGEMSLGFVEPDVG
jgi:hypothetical protein